MTPFLVVVALIVLQRLSELMLSQRNTRRLRARGAIEYGAAHYPLFVALHTAWLAGLITFVPWTAEPSWPLLGVFLLLQAARVWVIASLGPFWTTRIITLPGTPLVRRGPYRWMRHPNYFIVAGEIAMLPLAFGAWALAGVFSLLNAAIIWHRIRAENAALAERRTLDADTAPGGSARCGA